jgi:hypothetical protein
MPVTVRSSALVMLLAVGSCLGQFAERDTTPAGEFTGYLWVGMDFNEKLGFVLGFTEGHLHERPDDRAFRKTVLDSCLTEIKPPIGKQEADCITKSIEAKSASYKAWESSDPLPPGKFGETVTATDRFFAEPENRVMPIVAAWRIIKMKKEGERQSDIDAVMDVLRDVYIRSVRQQCESGNSLVGEDRCRNVGATLKKR